MSLVETAEHSESEGRAINHLATHPQLVDRRILTAGCLRGDLKSGRSSHIAGVQGGGYAEFGLSQLVE